MKQTRNIYHKIMLWTEQTTVQASAADKAIMNFSFSHLLLRKSIKNVLKHNHSTSTKHRSFLPYFCRNPTVQRKTPPNATSSPNTTATSVCNLRTEIHYLHVLDEV